MRISRPRRGSSSQRSPVRASIAVFAQRQRERNFTRRSPLAARSNTSSHSLSHVATVCISRAAPATRLARAFSQPKYRRQATPPSAFGIGIAQSDGRPGFVPFGAVEPLVAGGMSTRRLCRCDFFTIEWLDALTATSIPIEETGVPEVWMTLAGRARWKTASGEFDAPAGTTVLRPAHIESGAVQIDENSSILRCFCASPLDRAI